MFRFWISFLIAAFTGHAAERVDWLLSAGHVVTMDSDRRVIRDGAIAVRDGKIVAVGSRATLEKSYTPKQRLSQPESILTPGLVNTHTHAPMVLFRGIADDMRLQDWLEKFIFPAEAKNVDAEFVRWGTQLACMEMLLSGTTTYTDMYYFEDMIAASTKACGMRGVLGQTVIQFPVPDAKTPAEGLARAEAFLAKFAGDPLITAAVAPHAVYTNSDETVQAARQLANKFKAPMLIHVAETQKEVDDLKAQRGLSPVTLLERLGALNGRTVAAHGVHVTAEDRAILKLRHSGVAHCPASNMMLSSGVAPLIDYLRDDIAMGLGTDGPAGSNNDLNMFEEMDLAAKLQKVIRNDPTAITAKRVFEMATLGGARVLGLEDQIGSLQAGMRADVIFVQANAPHALPMFDVYSHLVYALKGSDVQHSMVNGRLVVKNRKVLTLNAAQVAAKAREYRDKIANSVGLTIN